MPVTEQPDRTPARASDPFSEALRMRASDADREKVADVVRDAYADGRLTRDEVDERLASVYRAMTYGELVPIVADLPVPPGTINVPQPKSGKPIDITARPVVNPVAVSPIGSSSVAIFSGFQRLGRWTAPEQMNAVCIFGGGEMDYTDATLTANETVVNVVAIFGGLDITVPEGLNVRNEIIGIMGGVDVGRSVNQFGDADAPTLVLRGVALFGGVEVHLPKTKNKRKRAIEGE